MTGNLFSLVLAGVTGWAVLAIGFLPIAVLRQQKNEALKAASAWAVVAATAPVAVYHLYLILAILCLVAWTRMDRPSGKLMLAVVASLGLSLGIVFPLEAVPDFLASENPFALASLYLGGASTGLSYAAFTTARGPGFAPRASGLTRALLIACVAWGVLLVAGLRGMANATAGLLFVPTIVLVALAFLAWRSARRGTLGRTCWLAGVAGMAAFGTSLFAQVVLR